MPKSAGQHIHFVFLKNVIAGRERDNTDIVSGARDRIPKKGKFIFDVDRIDGFDRLYASQLFETRTRKRLATGQGMPCATNHD